MAQMGEVAMINPEQKEIISMESVRGVLAEAGFETPARPDRIVFTVSERKNPLEIDCTLESNGAFTASASFEVNESAMTCDLTSVLLFSESGISTSSFRLSKSGEGRVIVTLSSFCRLRRGEDEDGRRIIACLKSLKKDVLSAQKSLHEYL